MVSEPRRPGSVPSSMTVTPGAATRSPMRPENALMPFAVEVALQPVADGFVQQHAVPAGAQHHVHLAGGAGDGVQVHERLAQRLVHLGLPVLRRDPGVEAVAAAGA